MSSNQESFTVTLNFIVTGCLLLSALLVICVVILYCCYLMTIPVDDDKETTKNIPSDRFYETTIVLAHEKSNCQHSSDTETVHTDLEHQSHDKISLDLDNHGRISCAICLDAFQEGESVSWSSDCHHVFHHSCLDEWVTQHKHCPFCRTPMTEVGDEELGESRQFCVNHGLVLSDHKPVATILVLGK